MAGIIKTKETIIALGAFYDANGGITYAKSPELVEMHPYEIGDKNLQYRIVSADGYRTFWVFDEDMG